MLPARCISPVLLRITIACREGKVPTEKTTCSRLRAQASESGCPTCPPAPARRMQKGPGPRLVALQPQHLCLSEVGPGNWVSFLTNQVAEYIQYDPMRLKLTHAQSNCYGLHGVTPPSLQIHVEVLPPHTSERDFIWKQSHCRRDQLR